MKFNALVVAAMVITSVNAGGRKGSPGCFGRRCGRSEPVVTQESTDESELKPVEPPKSADDDLKSSAYGLTEYTWESVYQYGSLKNPSNESQDLDLDEKTKICKDILKDISVTWGYIQKLNNRFEQQLPTVHGIMTDRSNKSGSVKDKEHKNSKAVKVQGFLKMRPDLIPPLEQVRARSIELEGAYRNLWENS
ncbi:hypothetical protein BASA50_010755 [Batrachochytrium salamandrivorans]|uniref:Uncharacterized protein n=1 Tax=Batrachochytrium salamandrivorans TaxID=1357716 RepID=A0ABQ8EYQ4_9FUNG|nr:hypothetical protein BASA50_010755 [Batrachochytrium salamandrivorans]